MVRKRFPEVPRGLTPMPTICSTKCVNDKLCDFTNPSCNATLSGIQWHKILRKVGLGKDDWYFWKQVGKSLLCTYALFGAAWVYNETSPLGWWTLKPRPKEEKELAHLYERRQFPYPGDKEAMEEFVAKGGMIGTTIGPKGTVEIDKDSFNYQKALQDKKFEQEAHKLWFRMRTEVIAELQEKGFDVE